MQLVFSDFIMCMAITSQGSEKKGGENQWKESY